MFAFTAMRGRVGLFALALLLPAGCATRRAVEQTPVAEPAFERPIRQGGGPSINLSARTVVESLTGPEDFTFVTIVP